MDDDRSSAASDPCEREEDEEQELYSERGEVWEILKKEALRKYKRCIDQAEHKYRAEGLENPEEEAFYDYLPKLCKDVGFNMVRQYNLYRDIAEGPIFEKIHEKQQKYMDKYLLDEDAAWEAVIEKNYALFSQLFEKRD